MELKKLIDLIRSVDVAANDDFAMFNRDGTIDVEAVMQVFVQDIFEDMEFMAQKFDDCIETLVGIYTAVNSLSPEDFGNLHHRTVDEFRHFGFTLEDRTRHVGDEPEEIRVIVTSNVTLIVERYGDDGDVGLGETSADEPD